MTEPFRQRDLTNLLPDKTLARHGIQPERLRVLSEKPFRPQSDTKILYWVQASPRIRFNHALETACLLSNNLGLPLEAGFVLINNYPGGNLRHYQFLLEGLKEFAQDLASRRVDFKLICDDAVRGVKQLANSAAIIVTDAGVTRFQIDWRARVANALPCPIVQVETDVVVPVETASGKEEYAARTIRPKILKLLDRFLLPVKSVCLKHQPQHGELKQDNTVNPDQWIKKLKIDMTVKSCKSCIGGAKVAQKRLKTFLQSGQDSYDKGRNDPSAQATSSLSPYLHFGQISPIDIALQVRQLWNDSPSRDAYLEQLIVRRELAFNFVYYNENYDNFACLPDWAKKEWHKHAHDPRPYLYSHEELERANTHDNVWNAAQIQMVTTGHMAGYMRMYWGKKVIEWSRTPEDAYNTLIQLNDKYELDGRDPNGYAGVAWCFGKHDRPWTPRPIFGTIRYMNAAGLARKFSTEAYCELVTRQAAQ